MTDDDPDPQPEGVLPSERREDRTRRQPVDPQDTLGDLRRLRPYVWEETDPEVGAVARVGPAAEEFYDVFGVGRDPDHIAAGDADGVVIAAVQGLADRLDEQESLVEHQRRQLRRQRERIDEQRADLETLREQVERLQSELARRRLESDDGDAQSGDTDHSE